jgi:hypothetical protein
MISFRQADLLDKINEDKVNELKKTFTRGSIVFEIMQGEILLVGADGTPEIKRKIYDAMSEAGFDMNPRSDGELDPYYTLVEDLQAPSAQDVIEGFMEFLDQKGFDSTLRVMGVRPIVEYHYYPLLEKKADLIPAFKSRPLQVGDRVKLNDATINRIGGLRQYYIGNVGTIVRIYEDMYHDMKVKAEVKWDKYVHTSDGMSKFTIESFERAK